MKVRGVADADCLARKGLGDSHRASNPSLVDLATLPDRHEPSGAWLKVVLSRIQDRHLPDGGASGSLRLATVPCIGVAFNAADPDRARAFGTSGLNHSESASSLLATSSQ